jgi:DNA-binding response OmpR family regulator
MAKIAIIEDDSSIAQMYRLKFENDGHKVNIAENGKIGLKLCEEMKPDLILLDLMMPEMNGDEMLDILRKKEWGKSTKVVVLTNISEQEAPEHLKQLGIDGYIVKAEMTPKQVAEVVKQKLGS